MYPRAFATAVSLAVLAAATCLAARDEQVLAHGWKFIRQDASLGAAPTAWESVTVPHTWNASDADGGKPPAHESPSGYYRGPGWYARTIDAPTEWSGRRVFLIFEAASTAAKVWLNGEEIGGHRGGFTAFGVELTPHLKLGAANDLRVRVDNSFDEALPPLSGDFNVYGGLYRPVHLLVTDPVCITPLEHGSPGVFIRQRELDATHAVVEVETLVASALSDAAEVTVAVEIRDESGAIVARGEQPVKLGARQTQPAITRLTWRDPHRWQGRRDPYLYSVVAQVRRAERIVDAVTQPLGLRTITLSPERGILLNGEPYPIFGVNRHQDLPGKGWAISDADHDRDFALIAEIGATAVRLAHYPQANHVYDLADQRGLLLWNELSLVDHVRTTPEFAANAESQLREMILQHLNHPSVMCWGLYNELREPDAQAGLPLLQHLNELAHALDPSRPTVAASNLMKPEAIHSVPDWIAFNTYPGWYSSAKAGMTNVIVARSTELHGQRIGISEYGAGASPNQHEEGAVRPADSKSRWHPEEWQAIVHEQDWREIQANRDRLWGTFVWNMFDFAAARRHEGENLGINDKGLVTRDRATRKDAFYFYQANWSSEPVVYITSRRLVERHQAKTAIKVYSNCRDVELLVNGRSLGRVKPDEVCVATWPDVALQPGVNTIVASGQRAGTEVHDTCEWTLMPTHAAAESDQPTQASMVSK